MNINTKCLICESQNLAKMKNYYEQHQLLKCSSCNFVFMEKIPTAEELDLHYGKYVYYREGYFSPLTKKIYSDLLDKFEKYRKTGKLLDVGCGRGWFLLEAKKRGWEVYGTEYSSTALEICKQQGLDVRNGKLLNNSFPENEFDVITSFEVIEHINNPLEEVQNINKFLRKGGLFYFTTPNFNCILRYYLGSSYDIIGYPEHLSYYTRNTISYLLKNNGFKKNKIEITGISITRFKTSRKISNESFVSKDSSDEIIRMKIAKKWHLDMIRVFINKILTITGLGMTLKGYFIKK